MIPWIPCYCTVGKNQMQPYYSNKLLKCVIVKIHSDTKPQNFDTSYKRKSKLSRQINQVGSAKSDQWLVFMTTTKPFWGECDWREAGFAYNEKRLLYFDVFYYKDDLSWLETFYFLFYLYSCFMNSSEFHLFTQRTNRRLLYLDPRYIKCTAVIAVVKLKYLKQL